MWRWKRNVIQNPACPMEKTYPGCKLGRWLLLLGVVVIFILVPVWVWLIGLGILLILVGIILMQAR